MKSNAEISVIIPTFNCEDSILKTIDSIENQTSSKRIEVIICDDCSTDQTQKLLDQYKSKKFNLKLLNNELNSGAAISRNKAIKAASGKYIMFCDADDIWDKNKIEKQIKFMEENDVPFSYTSYYKFNNKISESKLVKSKAKVSYKDLLLFNHICCSTVCYNAKFFGNVLMPNIRKRQDYALWLKMIKKVDFFHCLPEALMYKRVGHESISNNKFGLIKYNFRVLNHYEKIPKIVACYYLIRLSIKKIIDLIRS